MICAYKTTLTHIKTKEVFETEVIFNSDNDINDEYYKKRAIKNAGLDTTAKTWAVENFTFKNELIKKLQNY